MSEAYQRVLQRRRKRLRNWIRESGLTKAEVAQRCGWASSSFLVQMVGPCPTRWIRESVARHIEHSMRLPVGYLDQTGE